MEESNEKIINQYTDEWAEYFADYFENQRVSRIRQKSEYQKLEKEICKIKNEYPNVVTLLEDGENIKLSNEEEKAIIEILNLQEEINLIELKEAFKLGFKEAYIYFESMDMLKI